MKFLLNGCDISFYAEAPEDITLKDLLKQCDRIVPDWCACGICSSKHNDDDTEIYITYNDIWKANDDVSCVIKEPNEKKLKKEKNKQCPLFNFCNAKTAMCRVCLPDESCYWYRWFKQLIKKNEQISEFNKDEVINE